MGERLTTMMGTAHVAISLRDTERPRSRLLLQLVTVQAMRHARHPARIFDGHDRPCAVDARRADGRLVRINFQAQMLADDVAHPLFVGR